MNASYFISRGKVGLSLAFFLLALWSLTILREERSDVQIPSSAEVIYLPKRQALSALSFGYSSSLAHVFWFSTISYFGKHYRQDQSYPWLEHMCNVVTDLNPYLLHVYSFCSTMLSWEVGKASATIPLLQKGMNALPHHWELPYLLGFNYYYFLQEPAQASRYFVLAAQKNNAPPFLATLAAQVLSKDDVQQAISFLKVSIATMPSGDAQHSLRKKLATLIVQRDTPLITSAISRFLDEQQRAPRSVVELIKKGYLPSSLEHPGQGRYEIKDGGVIFTFDDEKEQ